MKKIITIITLGAAVAFLPGQAQEAPQTERTKNPSDVTNTAQEASVAEQKVEIDPSELPQPVMDSFEKSEYASMNITNAYEVNASPETDINSYQTVSNRDASDAGSSSDQGTTEEPNAQADRALDSAVYQSDETSEKRQRVDEHNEAIGETKTPEETEETGQTITADAPDRPMTDEEMTEKGKELYETNKYDNFTEATNDAYAEVAKEEVDNAKQGKKYELQVKSDNEEMTLIYDENGELVKAAKGAM